jgi:hypothetical protein
MNKNAEIIYENAVLEPVIYFNYIILIRLCKSIHVCKFAVAVFSKNYIGK